MTIYACRKINNVTKQANAPTNGARERTLGSPGRIEEDEYSGVDIVEIFTLYVMQESFFSEAQPFDEV